MKEWKIYFERNKKEGKNIRKRKTEEEGRKEVDRKNREKNEWKKERIWKKEFWKF